MNFTEEMLAEDEKRWHARDIITELGYCGNNMRDRINITNRDIRFYAYIMQKAHCMLKEQEKEIKALHLLVEWAEECDFGFDQFPDEYERYKDEIKDMRYIDGMIHIAKRTLEEGR